MATLKGIYGDTKGLVFELSKDETTIGRHGANMMVLNDASVSAFHCSIVKDGGKYTIRDLDSTNGTRVNSEPTKVRCLAAGSIVQVGNVELLFEGEDVESDDTTPPTPARAAAAAGQATPFAKPNQANFKPASRHGGRIVWVVVGGVTLVAAILVAWFLLNLSRWK